MIRFIPYQAEHAVEIAKSSLEKVGGEVEDAAIAHEFHPATTAIFEQMPVACFGVHELWPGVGDVWAIFRSDVMTLCPREFVQITREVLMDFMVPRHRIQCVVDASKEKAISFVEHYGFKREAIMRKYSADERDFYLYARVR